MSSAAKSPGQWQRKRGGCPVQIAYVKERLYVDFPRLEAILDQVAHHPVAVLSITGPMRTGKSFLLNYLVRYLTSSPYEKASGKWWHKQLDAEFGWSDSADVHTDGIFLWSEPLYVTQNDETVAILLLDVQGCFDSRTTTRESALLFAFCTVLSSTILCNVSTQLSEDSLHSLLFFTESAKLLIGGSGGDGGAATFGDFCKLVFLVRDWQSPQNYPYGFYEMSGGDQTPNFIRDKLQIGAEMSEEARILRQKLFGHFEDVGCCLLPYPGDQLACHGVAFSLSGQFADAVKDFVRRTLNARNVVVKTIEQREVKGYRLKYHVQKWLPRFGTSATLPAPSKAYLTLQSPRTTLTRKFRNADAKKAKPRDESPAESPKVGHRKTDDQPVGKDSRGRDDAGSGSKGGGVVVTTEIENRKAYQEALKLYQAELARGLKQDRSMLHEWHAKAMKGAHFAFEEAPRSSVDDWMKHYQEALNAAIDQEFSQHQKESSKPTPGGTTATLIVDTFQGALPATVDAQDRKESHKGVCPNRSEAPTTKDLIGPQKDADRNPPKAPEVGGAASQEDKDASMNRMLKEEVAKLADAMEAFADAVTGSKSQVPMTKTVVQPVCQPPPVTEQKPKTGDGGATKSGKQTTAATTSTQTLEDRPPWQQWKENGFNECDPSVDFLNQAMQSEYDNYQWRRREMEALQEAITSSVVRALNETVSEQLQSVTGHVMTRVQKTTTDCTHSVLDEVLQQLHGDLATVDLKLQEDLLQSRSRVSRIGEDIASCKELIEKLQNQEPTVYVCNFSTDKGMADQNKC